MSDKYQDLRDALQTGWDSAFAISATPEVVTALLADLDAAVVALEMMADYTADQGHLMQGLASSTLSQIKAAGREQA